MRAEGRGAGSMPLGGVRARAPPGAHLRAGEQAEEDPEGSATELSGDAGVGTEVEDASGAAGSEATAETEGRAAEELPPPPEDPPPPQELARHEQEQRQQDDVVEAEAVRLADLAEEAGEAREHDEGAGDAREATAEEGSEEELDPSTSLPPEQDVGELVPRHPPEDDAPIEGEVDVEQPPEEAESLQPASEVHVEVLSSSEEVAADEHDDAAVVMPPEIEELKEVHDAAEVTGEEGIPSPSVDDDQAMGEQTREENILPTPPVEEEATAEEEI
eukprot:CAMPEP_0170141158 /NCGR_PEP_ID=MMETSP0033_2-20121228/6825_1 /TAXON_ID=195969 /ORGANISM="Dolichomastix tenuilepis, Strain CCMP3274" /LENGTH=273 /DNA_ID=CAMNT_0010377409 /DNA_START=50 /DNA_END=868 /DNA_ORIENTATION=+